MSHMKRFAALGMTVIMTVSMIPMISLADSAAKSGWIKESGKWYFYDNYGKKVKYSTRYDEKDDKIYVLDGSGARVTKAGWYTSKYKMSEYYSKCKFTTKYYLKKGGAVTQGWKKISGKWYYFNYDGEMVKNGYGYKSVNGKWKYYLLGSNGIRITKKGWHQVKSTRLNEWSGTSYTSKAWYYVKSDGSLQTGWKKISGKYYHFNEDGGSLDQSTHVNKYDKNYNVSKVYVVDKNGARITKKGWVTITEKYSSKSATGSYSETIKEKYYIQKDGTAIRNCIKKISGKTYYFDYEGEARVNGTYTDYSKGIRYYFGKTGACTRTEKIKYDSGMES